MPMLESCPASYRLADNSVIVDRIAFVEKVPSAAARAKMREDRPRSYPLVNHQLGTWCVDAGFLIMANEPPSDPSGNEPAPLLLIAVAAVPLLGVLGWMVGLFG
jgi:hypothetical protein